MVLLSAGCKIKKCVYLSIWKLRTTNLLLGSNSLLLSFLEGLDGLLTLDRVQLLSGWISTSLDGSVSLVVDESLVSSTSQLLSFLLDLLNLWGLRLNFTGSCQTTVDLSHVYMCVLLTLFCFFVGLFRFRIFAFCMVDQVYWSSISYFSSIKTSKENSKSALHNRFWDAPLTQTSEPRISHYYVLFLSVSSPPWRILRFLSSLFDYNHVLIVIIDHDFFLDLILVSFLGICDWCMAR